jgi:hypothetical protein
MMNRNRRQFLADVGKGMLVASVGSALAAELGVSPAFAGESGDRLTFGEHEPLVALMQGTHPDKLLPILVDKLKNGTELRTLVAACALANARTCGGHDYNGYHAFMALTPSYQMSKELPKEKQALPVLKVLYRNARFMQDLGGAKHDALHSVEPVALPKGESLRDVMHKADTAMSEKTLAGLT